MRRSATEVMKYGAIAGIAASIPQAVVGKVEEILLLPPGEDSNIAPRLVDRLSRFAGERPSKVQDWALGAIFHLGYGGGWGAAYGLAAESLKLKPVMGGTLLGGIIYGITFPRWGGAVLTRTERPPQARSPQMTFVAWSVTVSFGIFTGVFYDLLARRNDPEEERRPAAASNGDDRRSASAVSAA